MSKWSVVAIAGLVIAAMTFASFSDDAPEWGAVENWLAERQGEWRTDGAPVVAEWPKEGCSRHDYRRAAELAARLPDVGDDRVTLLASEPEAPDGARLTPAQIQELAPIVAAIRAGAGRIQDVDRQRPRLGIDAATAVLDVLALQRAYGAVRLTARELARTDRAAAAALLLDGITAALDTATAGIGVERLIGQQGVLWLCEEFTDAMLAELDRSRLEKLDRALQDLIAVHPIGDGFLEREIAHRAACTGDDQRFDPAALGLGRRWVAWRHGFSMRSYARSAIVEQLELLERSRRRAPIATATWTERRHALDTLKDELRAAAHTGFMLPDAADIEESCRRAGVALRLLRLAVVFHLGEPLPQLRDLLGDGMLQVEIDGDRARFASADGMERAVTR